MHAKKKPYFLDSTSSALCAAPVRMVALLKIVGTVLDKKPRLLLRAIVFVAQRQKTHFSPLDTDASEKKTRSFQGRSSTAR
jgi:hypothetical protein